MADLPHFPVDLCHVRPVDGTFQRIGHDSEIQKRISEIGVIEPSLLPALRHIRRQAHSPVFSGDASDIVSHILRESFLSVCESKEQASFHVLVSTYIEEAPQRRVIHIIKAQHQVRLLRVRQTEYGREACLALHHLTGRFPRCLPVFKYIREAFPILGHVAEYLERHFRQDAERPFASHHDLVQVRARRLPRIAACLYRSARCRILLPHDDIGNTAIIGTVLSCAPRHDPSSDAAVFK